MKRSDEPPMARWGEPPVPPAALEERVLATLRNAGLVRSETLKGLDMKTLHVRWSVAAGVLLIVGLLTGGYAARLDAAATTTDARPQFALLLYENEGYRSAESGSGQTVRVAEYAGWARKLAAEGRLVDAGKLSDEGAFLGSAPEAGTLVPRAPEGVLTGYFVIRASDRAEAERVARESPHLKYGGTISLREIEA